MLDKYKRHELPDPHINMNPMIDVVFQLLLFFIIASNFSRPNEIKLDLPSSTSAAKPGSESALVVSYRPVNGSSELRVNGNPVDDIAQLGPRLRSLADPVKLPAVEIRIDKAAPYQDVIKLMDAVRDAGYPKFSLLTLGSATAPAGTTPDTANAPQAK